MFLQICMVHVIASICFSFHLLLQLIVCTTLSNKYLQKTKTPVTYSYSTDSAFFYSKLYSLLKTPLLASLKQSKECIIQQP